MFLQEIVRTDVKIIQCTGWRMKWSSIIYINKIFVSIAILETDIQKESHCMETYPLWIRCSIWPPLHLANSSTHTVMLLITWRHISSVILLQAWMVSALNPIIVCGFCTASALLRTHVVPFTHPYLSLEPYINVYLTIALRQGGNDEEASSCCAGVTCLPRSCRDR
jgi:hypothetical protein